MAQWNLEKRMKVAGWTVRSSDAKVKETLFAWASGDAEGAFLYGKQDGAFTGDETPWEWVVEYADMATLRKRRDEAAKDPADAFDVALFSHILKEIEANVEREQVEQIYGLTGGELETEPVQYVTEDPPTPDAPHWPFRHWYTGLPEWAEKEIEREHPTTDVTFFTAIKTDASLGYPAEVIAIESDEHPDTFERWERIRVFRSGSEAECPFQHIDVSEAKLTTKDEHGREVPAVGPKGCHLCEGDVGEEHGMIYLGEGVEAVYRRWDEHEEEGIVRIEKYANDERRYFVGSQEVAGDGVAMLFLDTHEGQHVLVTGTSWQEVLVQDAKKPEDRRRWVFLVASACVTEEN